MDQEFSAELHLLNPLCCFAIHGLVYISFISELVFERIINFENDEWKFCTKSNAASISRLCDMWRLNEMVSLSDTKRLPLQTNLYISPKSMGISSVCCIYIPR
jgi:hypothetical protein